MFEIQVTALILCHLYLKEIIQVNDLAFKKVCSSEVIDLRIRENVFEKWFLRHIGFKHSILAFLLSFLYIFVKHFYVNNNNQFILCFLSNLIWIIQTKSLKKNYIFGNTATGIFRLFNPIPLLAGTYINIERVNNFWLSVFYLNFVCVVRPL